MNGKNHIDNIRLFNKIDEKDKEKILKISNIKTLSKNSILFYEGDKSKDLHIVLKGKIEVYKVTQSGKHIPLNFFKPYELIAELSNYKNMPFPATAHALEESEVLLIDFKCFKEAFFSNPTIIENILESLSNKIIDLEKLISSQMTMNATQRVAHHLIGEKIDLNIQKHTTIADKLNISPVTLSRILKKFKTKQAIVLNRNRYSINKELLKRLYS